MSDANNQGYQFLLTEHVSNPIVANSDAVFISLLVHDFGVSILPT
jgi:hypothetical protein